MVMLAVIFAQMLPPMHLA